MAHAYEVMVEAKQTPGVEHTFYAQGEWKWTSMFTGVAVTREKGVCHGLCLRWIKSAHQTSLLNLLSQYGPDRENPSAKNDAIRASVVRAQETFANPKHEKSREVVIPSRGFRDDGGFGSRTILENSRSNFFCADYRYPNQTGIMCSTPSDLRRKVAESVAESRASYEYASVINMTPELGTGHAVAVVAKRRRVRFFDPNGGVLQFTSRDQFRTWFVDSLGDIDFYGDRGTLFEVVNYLFYDD